VAVFAGTTLNQTGQAVEVVAMTMAVYLTISLVISMFMNWYNKRNQMVER
jgi:general L-amino acid transport system permease protein